MKAISLALAILVFAPVALAKEASDGPTVPEASGPSGRSAPRRPSSVKRGMVRGGLWGAIAFGTASYLGSPAENRGRDAFIGVFVGLVAGGYLGALGGWGREGEKEREAEPAQRASPVSDPPALEGGILWGQTLGGVAAAGLMIAPTLYLFDHGGGIPTLLMIFLAPAADGLTVCGVGRYSDYRSSCAASVAGAYLGVFAGAYAGYALGAGPGFVAGGFVGAALGATAGWHLGRHLRARPMAPAPDSLPPPSAVGAWPELRQRPTLAGADLYARGLFMFPLFSTTF
jgi:hypothetical protein